MNIFNKTITIDKNSKNTLFYDYPLKGGKIKIGQMAKVEDGFMLMIVAKNRILDTFSSGEVFFAVQNLPRCCKVLKIHNSDKSGKSVKSFSANLYFANKSQLTKNFKTPEKVELGNYKRGIFSVGANVNLSFCIADCNSFMSNILSEYSYIKTGEAEKYLNDYVGDCILNILRKNNFALSEILQNSKDVESAISVELAIKLQRIGIKLTKFNSIDYILNKKYAKQYEENKKNNGNNHQIVDDSQLYINKSGKLKKNKLGNNCNDNKETYVPFGNVVIEKIQSQDNIIADDSRKEQNCLQKCKKCGNLNIADAKFCNICGKKL